MVPSRRGLMATTLAALAAPSAPSPASAQTPVDLGPVPVWTPVASEGDQFPIREPFTGEPIAHWNQSAFRPHSIAKAANYPSLYRFEITGEGESWSVDPPTSQRAEYHVRPTSGAGEEVWVSTTLRITGVDPRSRRWCIPFQLHATRIDGDSGFSPPLELSFNNETGLAVITRSSPVAPITSVEAASRVVRAVLPVEQGRFHRLLVRTVPGPAGTGSLQIWWDGELRVDLREIPLGYAGEGRTYYPKWGIYTGPRLGAGDRSIVVEHANMEISRRSLAARSANPLPLR